MKCSKCHSDKLSTIDSRPSKNMIRRRKKCDSCGYRFSTYELSKSLIDYYENQMKRLLELEQFQKDSCSNGMKWTKSETERLIVMYFNQYSFREIAEVLNRSYKSVEQKLINLRKKDKLKIS